ncbi:GH12 family glycosyl hydrolase domain-containing protein [Pectobacterium versatile]|uniref:GH12 family glycosyl hydrolase domain-containing protein n=1 Tax=Pectobacterium versatile TaxID=2488639 RepID=UPI000D615DE5|nr:MULTISPECIES: glycoside hydrolase [Pectobacterium]MBA0164047.1 glycoside hydrolase [Pectobacterium versatile]MBA0184619.1 glycoside hydrolase [Pectobacterium versatile]MBD0847309.1 glycoside hydrolase [Pectobacterium carotovorum subsp. carotovorum]MBK4825563.1 Endoglucanase [Pectobacterium carotovorum subsp. carotovorum]MBN3236601.1 glycoside hydrolase [Pectobacterium versatile]
MLTVNKKPHRIFHTLFPILFSALLLSPFTASAVSSSKDADKLYFENNKYYVFNNVWGKDEVKGWQQTVFYNSPTSMGWNWHWPSNSSSVKAYPSLVSGWHWTAGYTANSGLPIKLSSNKSITSNVTYSIKSTGTYNAAYDIWFHTTDKASWDSTPTDELMIWLNNTNAGPAGDYIETVFLGGSSWNVFKGWINAGNGKGWNVFSFVRTSNTNNASLNIRHFTNYLVGTKKWMSNTKYISSVEFGTEIFGGDGQIDITKWSVDVK